MLRTQNISKLLLLSAFIAIAHADTTTYYPKCFGYTVTTAGTNTTVDTLTTATFTLNTGATCAIATENQETLKFGAFPTGVSATYAQYDGIACEIFEERTASAGNWYGPNENGYTCYVEYNITNTDASGQLVTVYVELNSFMTTFFMSIGLVIASIAYFI